MCCSDSTGFLTRPGEVVNNTQVSAAATIEELAPVAGQANQTPDIEKEVVSSARQHSTGSQTSNIQTGESNKCSQQTANQVKLEVRGVSQGRGSLRPSSS